MKTNQAGIELIKKWESLRLKAYLCSANVWTIGWGSTYYEDGIRVKKGDVITKERADELFAKLLPKYEFGVCGLLKKPVNENQFSALVSFAYNIGYGKGGLADSTLLKKVNANPNDESISAEFLRWNKAGGKVLNGLTKRRHEECDLYMRKNQNVI